MSAAEAIHATGIGASDIGPVAGISRFSGPWPKYAEKKGLIEIEQTEAMFWGKELQRVIADVFSRRMNVPIEWWDQRIYSRERPWQYASPDAFVLSVTDPIRRVAVLECKTAGLHQAGDWSQTVKDERGAPEEYVAQCEWQMSVCGLDLAYIAVLIAGQDFRIYKIRHDPVREEVLLEIGEKFWREHLLSGVEPPITPSREANDYLKQRYPRELERLRPATIEEAQWLDEYAAVRTKFDSAKTRREELEIALKKAIGNGEGLRWSRGKFTWKKSKDRSEVNWEKLAESQLVGFAEDERTALLEQYTEVVHGERRIHFHEEIA